VNVIEMEHEIAELKKRIAVLERRAGVGVEQSPEALFALGRSYANRDKVAETVVPKGWEGR